jgi:nitric oxide dioxygenase
MTPEQIELVRSSYASLREGSEGDGAAAMARDFYRHLFELDPRAAALFSQDPEVMATKFSDELAAIVQAIVSYDAFTARIGDLAARHTDYGVRPQHYRAAGDALVAALAAHLAPDWDGAHEAAWRRAFNLVAELMMRATAEGRR